MALYRQSTSVTPRLWITSGTTLLACIVAVVASINLYGIEDNNPLTQVAYSASSLLRFSYDGVYLSGLLVGVAACALIGYLLVRSEAPIVFSLIFLALLVASGGFGGLIIRQPLTFLSLFAIYIVLALICFFLGRTIASQKRAMLDQRTCLLLGACISADVALLVNLVALTVHTLVLNPINHTLFMQGRIGTTPYNSLVIGLTLELLTILIALTGTAITLRSHTTR